MPKYMTVGDVRGMTYPELERWWEVDFEVLVTSAVAEATGPVHPSVREALDSDDWIEQWADALFAGTGELASSVERMQYLRSERLERTRKRLGDMQQRMQYVNRRLKDRERAQGWEMGSEAQKDGRAASLSILARHHHAEFIELRTRMCSDRGLPVNDPLFGVSYKDAFDAIEDGWRRGFLTAPVGRELERLARLSDDEIKRVVATDVSDQLDRIDSLRHPLMLRRWKQALSELLEEHSRLNGLTPSFTITLPGVSMKEMWQLPEEQARRLLNRRRFLRALAQRNRECEMHRRQLVRAATLRAEEAKQPWMDAAQAAREEIARRHPDEFAALLAAFTPFCVPGSTRFAMGALGRRARGELVHNLKQKLEDGTLLPG